MPSRAQLNLCCVNWSVGAPRSGSAPESDRLREFGERRGDPQCTGKFGGEFVVAAAQVLHEREPGDDHLSGAVGA